VTRIALVGCGYVADYYVGTLRAHPELKIAGVTDRIPERASRFAAYYKLPVYPSLEAVLNDESVQIVVNLTNPQNHYAVSRACLEAGKHVYSEKPLSTLFGEAEELVKLAERQRLYLASAPCGILSETAQSIAKALRQGRIGRPLLAYAELDDGFLPRKRYRNWRSDSGSPWPWQDEFQVGCTLEHAGYYLSWLVAFFGPAETVTAFSTSRLPEHQAPDFSVACIRFVSGAVARLTCSILAPKNHGFTIIGDTGILWTDECWDYLRPIRIQKYGLFYRVTEKYPSLRHFPLIGGRRYPLTKSGVNNRYRRTHGMDFARGIAELAAAITEGRTCRLSPRFSLHVNELVLAIQNSDEGGETYRVASTFDPSDLLN